LTQEKGQKEDRQSNGAETKISLLEYVNK